MTTTTTTARPLNTHTTPFQQSLLLDEITANDITALFKYPQPVAAQMLGVSLSTLKRRFYSLNMGTRWPYNTSIGRYDTIPRNRVEKKPSSITRKSRRNNQSSRNFKSASTGNDSEHKHKLRRGSLAQVLNCCNTSETYLDQDTLNTLSKAFYLSNNRTQETVRH